MTRITLTLVSKLLELGFDAAIAVDRWLDRRKARKNQGLSFRDVQHQQAQIARATRASARTVVLPRPTSRPASADDGPPTEPSTPGRRR